MATTPERSGDQGMVTLIIKALLALLQFVSAMKSLIEFIRK